jgi:uncharacterized protein YbjT (DUF2867 family)
MGAILITGASGYIGGRLAQRLVGAGVGIRVAGRDPEKLTDRWPDRVGGTRDWASLLDDREVAHFDERLRELAGEATTGC